jgi:hypothetical protein
MARLTAFAQDTESIWLAGDGAVLDAFAHEVRVLAAAVEPLGALAKRQRTLTAAAARGQRSLKQALEQALQDGRVVAQLERLVRSLHELLELVPHLAPMPPGSEARPWEGSAPRTLGSDGWRGEPEDGLAAPLWPPEPVGPTGLAGQTGPTGGEQIPQGLLSGRWAARWLAGLLLPARWLGGLRQQRRARVVLAVGLAVGVLVLAMSGTVALLHGLQPAPRAGLPVSQQARATATQGGSATTSPVGSAAAASPTPVPDPAQLAVSPTSVVLPCSGSSVTLTVRDTGGQRLTWQASVSGNATLSPSSGTVVAHSETTVSAHATRTQHGPGAIMFTSNGGRAMVTFKVSCHWGHCQKVGYRCVMVVDGVVTAGREVTEKMASHDARAGSGIRRVASRGVLHDLLTDVDHYEVTEVSTEAVALAYLAACPEGVVTVCSNSHPDHHLSTACFAAVVADKRLAQRHQYILLSTTELGREN